MNQVTDQTFELALAELLRRTDAVPGDSAASNQILESLVAAHPQFESDLREFWQLHCHFMLAGEHAKQESRLDPAVFGPVQEGPVQEGAGSRSKPRRPVFCRAPISSGALSAPISCWKRSIAAAWAWSSKPGIRSWPGSWRSRSSARANWLARVN